MQHTFHYIVTLLMRRKFAVACEDKDVPCTLFGKPAATCGDVWLLTRAGLPCQQETGEVADLGNFEEDPATSVSESQEPAEELGIPAEQFA